MGKYRENNEEEPTFSLHDFKKWLQGQNKNESVREPKQQEDPKEELKEKFFKKKKKKP